MLGFGLGGGGGAFLVAADVPVPVPEPEPDLFKFRAAMRCCTDIVGCSSSRSIVPVESSSEKEKKFEKTGGSGIIGREEWLTVIVSDRQRPRRNRNCSQSSQYHAAPLGVAMDVFLL